MFALLAGAGFYAQKSQPVSTLDEEVSGILGDKQSSAGASFYASSPTATARSGHGHLSGHAQDRAVDFSYNAADMLK